MIVIVILVWVLMTAIGAFVTAKSSAAWSIFWVGLGCSALSFIIFYTTMAAMTIFQHFKGGVPFIGLFGGFMMVFTMPFAFGSGFALFLKTRLSPLLCMLVAALISLIFIVTYSWMVFS